MLSLPKMVALPVTEKNLSNLQNGFQAVWIDLSTSENIYLPVETSLYFGGNR